MTINPLFRRLVLLTAFLCTLVLTTQQSGVLQGASEPPTRDLNLVHEVLQKGPQDYYLAGQPSLLPAVESDAQQLQEVPYWSILAVTSFKNNNPDIFMQFLDGGAYQLTNHGSTQTDPSLNPGSSTVYFSSNQTGNAEIFAVDANGQNQRQFTGHPANDYNLHVSPDGTKIVFQSTRTGNSEIFVVGTDGTNLLQLTYGTEYDGYPNWSPDSQKVVYVSASPNSYDLWTVNVDGSNRQQITAGTIALAPDWSPDGTRIAYANDSDRNGFFELWVMNANGSGPTQLRSAGGSPIDYWTPTWSPDSQWLGYSVTEWIYYQNRWYWTASNFHWLELATNFEQRPFSDDTIWEADWGHRDIHAPSCQITIPEQSAEQEVLVSWGGLDTESGVKSYDVKYRFHGDTIWHNLVTNTPSTSQTYVGPQAGIVEFRCRACDIVGNCANIDTAEIKTVFIDTIPPESRMKTSANYKTDNAPITLIINRNDVGTGVTSFDYYIKDGINGSWELAGNDMNVYAFPFTGEPGHIYYFFSRATDRVGNQEVWQPIADDFVVVYATSLSGSVTDNRGNPAVATPLTLSPSATYSITSSPSHYELLLGESPTHTLTFQPAGYDPMPSTVLTTTSNITFNLALAPEDNLLSNSHFETGDTAGWNGSGFSANTTHHTGAYGVALTQELTETAALTQTIVLTNTLHEPTLSFWYHIPVTLENRALIVSVQGISDTVQVISTTAATSGWVHAWADVSALAGQTVTVSIEATPGAGSVYLDEITLGSWNTPQITQVTPTYWLNTEAVTLTITGSNFVATPTVWIAGVEMTHTTWLSSTELMVVVPAGVPAGRYFVEVQNPNGPVNFSPTKVHIDDLSVYLPLVRR